MNLIYLFRKVFRPRIVSLSGVMLHVSRSQMPAGVCKAIYKGNYEKNEGSLVLDVVKRGDRVLDIGSGIGFISLLCAKICGDDNVRIYEANPGLEKLIRDNFELNGMEPDLQPRAVSVDGEEVEFFIATNFLSSSLYDRGKGRMEKVPSDRFADIVLDFRPNIIVMDVEGAEVDLLNSSHMDSVRKLLLELHPHVVGYERISGLLSHLHSLGFYLHTDKCTSNVAYLAREEAR